MSFLDVFKKKDDFDNLLKEPEGGNWDAGGSESEMGGQDLLGQSPTSDPLLAQPSNTPAGMPSSTDPLGQSFDVMGLPPQSNDIGLGSDSDIPSFNDNNSFSSNNTSASTLNLNTNYPSNPSQSSDNNQNTNTYQTPVEERPASNSGGLVGNNQELDLIITKLDLLKSTLQNLDNRLYHIEKKLFEESNNKNTW